MIITQSSKRTNVRNTDRVVDNVRIRVRVREKWSGEERDATKLAQPVESLVAELF